MPPHAPFGHDRKLWPWKAQSAFGGSPVGFGRIAANAGFLGAVGTLHACLAVYTLFVAPIVSPLLLRWAYYGIIVVAFHTLEFVLTAAYNPRTATAESFLLNHSPAYKIAAVTAWIEFAIEAWAFPDMKASWATFLCGAAMTLGQLIRTMAMATAKSNFTHQVSSRKQREHQLVTSGLYAYLRHPSYFGWFWWSVGTQVLLGNPVRRRILCCVMEILRHAHTPRRRMPGAVFSCRVCSVSL